MDIRHEHGDGASWLVIDGAIGIAHIADLHAAMQADEASAVGLDLTQVTDLDTAGVQWLIAATAGPGPRALRVRGWAPRHAEQCLRLGVTMPGDIFITEEPTHE
jgi:anti-anti-sigma regulatory factor